MLDLALRQLILVAALGLAVWLARKAPRAGANPPPAGIPPYAQILAVGIGLLIVVSCFLAPATGSRALGITRRALSSPGAADSWRPLSDAAEFLRAAPGQPVYAELFFTRRSKLQYPITSVLAWDLLQRATGFSRDAMWRLANLVSFAMLVLSGLLSCLILRNAWTRQVGHAPPEARFATWGLMVSGIACAFLFYPLAAAVPLGQIQATINLLAIGAILAWQTGRHELAGVLIGLCCLGKPQWLVALVWGLVRGEKRFAGSGLAIVALAGVAAGVAYGFGQYVDYLPALSYMSSHGEAFYPNQSVNGIVNRLLENGPNLRFDRAAFAPYNAVVHAATLASAAALLGVVFLRGRGRPQSELDLSVTLLALTMASPIAWAHHYGLLLAVFAVAVPTLLRDAPLGRATPWVVGGLWTLSGQAFPFLDGVARSPYNLLQSYLFASALVLFVLVVARRPATAVAAAGTPQRPA